jgi:transposase
MGRKTREVRAGIDVSAAELVVAVRGSDGGVRAYTVDNNAKGHETLIAILTKARKPVYVAMEATGTYHLDAALTLASNPRIHVMLVNPKAARKFAEAQMRRAKTDRVDAIVLLEFVERMEFIEWNRPTDAVLQLRMLGRHLTTLIEERVAVENRMHAVRATQVTPTFIIADLQKAIDQLSDRIDRVQAEALDAVQRDHTLMEKFAALTSIPGIAKRSGIQILSELAVLAEDMTPDEVVAHAGLDPRVRQSGSSDPRRSISHVGNNRLRAALYMPALTAARHSPAVSSWYGSLIARDKIRLVAQVAVMRRLLRVAWVLTVQRANWSDELFRPKPRATREAVPVEPHREQISP